jgi:hypothetical protein
MTIKLKIPLDKNVDQALKNQGNVGPFVAICKIPMVLCSVCGIPIENQSKREQSVGHEKTKIKQHVLNL